MRQRLVELPCEVGGAVVLVAHSRHAVVLPLRRRLALPVHHSRSILRLLRQERNLGLDRVGVGRVGLGRFMFGWVGDTVSKQAFSASSWRENCKGLNSVNDRDQAN